MDPNSRKHWSSDLGLSFLATKEMKRTIAYSAAVIRTITKIFKIISIICLREYLIVISPKHPA